ncbi:LLM class F420-dependent oxidoreductase [Blastococcus sp. Marseille-P5729]|uniref:LLM class F420-dependent oxidoreductase n=1 Tax=Blastococcus sp. Marseille-P5729 TaxID=2086582 RepID=UPI000D0F35B2|nr:LLM class F420-dependent oxidoreductase [Blastococcus sp. Marseille-P5729]
MRLGLGTGYWSSGPPEGVEQAVAQAEQLGFDSLWTAEAYGSDALTPLAWWGARTSRLRLGTSVCQMSARTPTALAMAALTMDHLSGGRVIVGIGASGPQVVEGWYGQPYPRPLERTREYVEIMRAVWRRDEPVSHHGKHYQLPYAGGAGLGKPLKSTVHPLRTDIPVFLGAEGPKNVALAAEIADGWIPLWFSPKSDAFYRAALAEGFARDGARHDAGSFDVASMAWIIEHEDVDVAASFLKPAVALYAGGMGAKQVNFHKDVFARMGWGEVVEEVQELYLAGRSKDAAQVIPTAMVEDVALIGPAEKIVEDYQRRWRDTCLTTLILHGIPKGPNGARILDAIRE